MNARAEIHQQSPLFDRDPATNSTPHRGRVLESVNGYDVVACEHCGFTHVLPLPTPESLQRTYAEEYYESEKPTYLVHASEDEAWAALGYDDRLDAMSAELPPARRRLLEIGSGPGLFLARAVEKGWTAMGVEPSRQAASFARARGLSIHHGFFDDGLRVELSRTEAPFDALHLMNVLEHVPDPAALIDSAAQLLAPDAVVCIGVPNDFNPLQRLLQVRRNMAPWWLAPPHHLNYFNFETLERLVRRLGLDVRARLTSFPMELFVALGRNYVGDDELGRTCHGLRKAFDQDLNASTPGARRALYQALAQAGFGREAIIIAVKP